MPIVNILSWSHIEYSQSYSSEIIIVISVIIVWIAYYATFVYDEFYVVTTTLLWLH